MSKVIRELSSTIAVFILCMLAFEDLYAQQSVGIGTTAPNPNAILELKSDHQGILVPRLSTSQRLQMVQILQTTSSNDGMIVFDRDTGKFYYWFSNQWNEGLGSLSSSTVNGDLEGSLPNPNVTGIQGRPVSSNIPTNDQVLKWDGTAWVPSRDIGIEYEATEGLEVIGNTIKIGDEGITQQKIAHDAVTTNKIADRAVTLDKIATGSNSTFLSIDANGTLQWEDKSRLVSSSLGTGKIFVGNNAGTAEEQAVYGDITIAFDGEATIVENSIGSSQIIDGSIATVDMADEAITNEKIADEAVTESKLADQAIGLQKIKTTGQSNALLTINSDGEAVWFSPGNNRVIITTNDGQIFTEGRNAFATSALPEGNIFVGNSEGQAYPMSARTKGRILIGNGATLSSVAVTGDININELGVTEIQMEAVTTSKIADEAITSAKILDGTVQTEDLADASVTEAKIVDNAVTTAKIADANITTDKLANSAVTSEKIADGTVANADLDKANIPLSGFGAATADVDLGSNRLSQVADPTEAQDAATKHYVDGQVDASKDLNEGHVYIGDNSGKATALDASAAGNILVGDGTTINPVAVGGDIALAADGNVTISNDAVTSEKILDGTVANADLDKSNIPLSGFGAAAADVDLGSNKLSQVADPTEAQDAATKHYVDGQLDASKDLNEGHVYIGDNTGKASSVDASAAGNILVGDGTTINPVAVSGDIALSADGNVTISDNAVTSEKILDGTIQTGDLADASVTGAKIVDNAVTTAKIADANITTDKLANSAVTSEKIADGTIANVDLDKANIPLSGFGAAAADVDLGNNRLSQVADPTDAQDAATKHYVDGQLDASKDLNEGHVYIGDNTGKASSVDASAAGNILVGDGTTINPVAVSGDIALSADGNVTISDNAVTSEKILDGTIQTGDLADASVTGAKIVDNAVTTAKIADANITTDKLANSAVTSEKIADGTIANVDLDKANIPLSGFGAAAADVDLGNNRLSQVADPTEAQDAATKHYVDGQLDASKDLNQGHVYIGDNSGKASSVDASAAGNILVGDGTTINPVAVSGDIALSADGNVTISNDAVTSEKILDGTIQTGDLADASVTGAKIVDNAVTTAKIADANITTDKLANSAVTTDKVEDEAITSAKILDGTVQTEDLADGSITNQKISTSAVTSDKIADGTVANVDLDKANIPLSGFGAAAADVDLGSNRLSQVADPTEAQDAATKHYVDGLFAADGDKDDENEIQDLSLSSDILSLSLSTHTVDLSPYLDNTDNQNLGSSKSGTQITVTIDNGTAATFDISDGDSDPTNESLTAAVLDGTDLKITESGNETIVDLSSLKDIYTGGNAIEVTGNNVAAQYDGVSIGLNASNELELMAGAVSNDKIADRTIDFIKVANSGAENGQVMVWNNSLNKWTPENATAIIGFTDGDITAVTTPNNSGLQGGKESGDVILSLVNTGDGEILIGNGTNITATTVSGAISLSSSGNTAINSGAVQSNHLSDNAVSTNKIADGAITSEKLAGMSASEGQVMTFKSGKWVAESPASNSTSITRTSYYAVDPLDFVVLGQAGVSHTSYPITPDEAMYVAVENSNNSASIAAPIHLPHGATIQEVTFYYMDDENGASESKDIVFELTRKARRNGPNETIASFTTSDASTLAQEAVVADITNGTVDNSEYSYRIIAALRGSNSYGSSKHRIYSVVIKYSETIQHD